MTLFSTPSVTLHLRHSLGFVVLYAAALLFATTPAHGQTGPTDEITVQIGPRVTFDAGDIDDTALGGALRVRSPGFPIQGSAAFDLYLADEEATVFTVDLNGQIPVRIEQWFVPYLGTGLGITRISGQAGGGSTTDLGLNLMVGAEIDRWVVHPFVQSQLTLGSDVDRVGLSLGLLVEL